MTKPKGLTTAREEEHMAHEDIVAHRYWNTNWMAVVVVAVEGGNNDVAAYIGGPPHSLSEEEAVEHVKRFGAKLIRDEAHRFLPQLADIDLHYRD